MTQTCELNSNSPVAHHAGHYDITLNHWPQFKPGFFFLKWLIFLVQMVSDFLQHLATKLDLSKHVGSTVLNLSNGSPYKAALSNEKCTDLGSNVTPGLL